MTLLRHYLFALCIGCAGTSLSAEMLNVPKHIWDGLSAEQRASLGERYVVNLLSGKTYGTIIDVQSLNESTAGTNVGSQLGAQYGSAAYVDNAFKGSPGNWNYSATNHLTAQVVGGILGSLADQKAQARFRTRYTVKNGDGGVEYIDEIKTDAFRHSMGLCMAIGPLRPIEMDICSQTREQFLAKNSWLVKSTPAAAAQVVPIVASPVTVTKAKGKAVAATVVTVISPAQIEMASSPPSSVATTDDAVLCKFGMASPVRLQRGRCEVAGGTVLP